MFFLKKKQPLLSSEGFLPSLGLSLYVGLVTLLISQGNALFGNSKEAMRYLGPLLFLMLFVVSAMVSALIVFYKPYLLFMQNKGKEALQLVLSTTKWLAVFLSAILLGILVFLR